MRAVIRVIDTAAVITGAVTQDNRKEEGSRVPLDTQTHVHVAFRVEDGGKAFCLKSKRVQTLLGQSECWQEMRWEIEKQTELQIKSRPTPLKHRHTVSQARRKKGKREKEKGATIQVCALCSLTES